MPRPTLISSRDAARQPALWAEARAADGHRHTKATRAIQRKWDIAEARKRRQSRFRHPQRLDRLRRGRRDRTRRPVRRHPPGARSRRSCRSDILDLGAALHAPNRRATATVERIVELRAALARAAGEGGSDRSRGAVRARRLQPRGDGCAKTCCSARRSVPSWPTRRSPPTPISARCSSENGLDADLYEMGLEIAEQRDRAVQRPAAGPSVLPAARPS